MSFPKHGKNGVVKLGATGGSAKVLQLKGWSYDEKIDTPEITVAEDTAKAFTTGSPEWTGSIDVLFDGSDATGQGAMTIGASVTVNFYDETPTTGVAYRAGTAIIDGVSKTLAIDGIITQKFSIKGNGALAAPVTL